MSWLGLSVLVSLQGPRGNQGCLACPAQMDPGECPHLFIQIPLDPPPQGVTCRHLSEYPYGVSLALGGHW